MYVHDFVSEVWLIQKFCIGKCVEGITKVDLCLDSSTSQALVELSVYKTKG